MTVSPRSKQFDDVYFSQENGLAETRHVFIAGNDLPVRWTGRESFTIFETGFGTGLNFLAAWTLFRETAEPGQNLCFFSVEKFPLSAPEIKDYLAPWREELGAELDVLVQTYSKADFSGSFRFVQGNVSLELFFGDVNVVLPTLEKKVDCWFLDGFKPATNPGMWTETVFENMARLSNPKATFATFTAAGVVKRGLAKAGFTVEKVKGFGKKRDMLKGFYS